MVNETPIQKKPILDKEFQVQGETQIFCPRCKRPIKGYLEVSIRLVSKGQVVPQPSLDPTSKRIYQMADQVRGLREKYLPDEAK